MPTLWTVQRTTSRRFPFRIAIVRDGRTEFCVRAQSAWPGPGQQIFCLREDELDPAEHLEPLETVAVVSFAQIGRKTTLVLDRPTRKRCEFLLVRKPYAEREGSYEQIFFRTESGIKAHRSRSRLELRPVPGPLTIAVDSGEKYAWSFPGSRVTRRRLAAGDYALLVEGRTVAVLERKSFDGLLTDLGAVQALHHQFADLARVDRAAVVIEAQYGDFLDPRRLAGRWPPAFVARALAELAALHPRLPLVFAGSRKLANQWAADFFSACVPRPEDPQLSLVRELPGGYTAVPLEVRIREAALAIQGPMTTAALLALVPEGSPIRVRRVLAELEAEGLLERTGRGRGTRWVVKV